VNTKYLIAFGCTISALSLFVMASWNLQIDYRHAVLAQMMQSFGLAFCSFRSTCRRSHLCPRKKRIWAPASSTLARKRRGQRGDCHGDDAFAAAHSISSGAVDGARESAELAYHNWLPVRSRDCLTGSSGGYHSASQAAGMVYQHGAAAGGNDGLYR